MVTTSPQMDTAAEVLAEPGGAIPPAVSVVIPAYNAAPYISEALDSVLAQTFTDYEIIVVNDGSPDTAELGRALAPYLRHIVYIEQENRGPGGARNAAILRARGEYVALLDSDDVWLPQYLTEQVKILRRDESLDLLYADALLFGDSALAGQTFMQHNPTRGPVTFESLLRWECAIITSCVVARRQPIIDAGLFDESFFHAEDFDLWLRLAHRRGRFAYQQKVLARHRIREGSLSTDRMQMYRSQVDILKKAARTLALSRSERELLTKQIVDGEAYVELVRGKQHFWAGEYDQAAEAFARANSISRSRKLQLLLLGLRISPRLLHRIYALKRRVMRRRSKPVRMGVSQVNGQ